MKTSTLITLLKKDYPSWSRESLRDIINEVHSICLTMYPVGQMRVYGVSATNSTGDPVFSTTDGVFEYEIDTVNGYAFNAWRITDIYETSIDSQIDFICYDATEGAAAKIVFLSNPGTKSYYYRVYKKPTQITAESIELQIPSAYTLFHFKEGVSAYVELSTNGRPDRWFNFQNKILPEIIDGMNSGQRNHQINVTYKGY